MQLFLYYNVAIHVSNNLKFSFFFNIFFFFGLPLEVAVKF